MRNILIHTEARGVIVRGELDAVVLRGHAFDVARVIVTLRHESDTRSQTVSVDPHGHWTAQFTRASGGLPPACRDGARVFGRAADADDPDGCYSTIEADLRSR